jgi:hypothetical protein
MKPGHAYCLTVSMKGFFKSVDGLLLSQRSLVWIIIRIIIPLTTWPTKVKDYFTLLTTIIPADASRQTLPTHEDNTTLLKLLLFEDAFNYSKIKCVATCLYNYALIASGCLLSILYKEPLLNLEGQSEFSRSLPYSTH